MANLTTKSRDILLSTIPRGSISLANIKIRKRSDEDIEENKRSKVHSKESNSGSEVESNTEHKTEENMGESTKIADMILIMKEALKDDGVSEILTSKFREECKSMIAESKREIVEQMEEIIEDKIDEKMKKMEEISSTQEERLKTLEKWADTSEQDSRSTNIVIRGLTTSHTQNEEELINFVASTLSRKLEIKLLSTDIRFVMRLG